MPKRKRRNQRILDLLHQQYIFFDFPEGFEHLLAVQHFIFRLLQVNISHIGFAFEPIS